MSKKKPYIFMVSTKPDISSYKWIGTELSLLSTIILWTLWLFRLLSLYQHLKAIKRVIGGKLATIRNADPMTLSPVGAFVRRLIKKPTGHKITNESGRPDIPPMMGEIYFICWTVLFALAHAFGWDNLALRILTVYYLFESCVWIFYYTVFRRFFEVGYSIYHKLEYLTAMFLIIPTQALCFAKLYGLTFRTMLMGLLGGAAEDTPFPVVILGCLFSAIVISMIISTFPMEAIKKEDTRPNMFIVGCGDVVTQRLYPALVNGKHAKKLLVYDLEGAPESAVPCTRLQDEAAIGEAIDRRVTDKDVVWVETPSFAHVSYVKRLLDTDARLIVVEKPIAVSEQDLAAVEALVKNPKTRSRLFFLSYYTLEKALPLHFLAHFNDAHEKYLDIDDESLIKNWRVLLGALRCAKVHICEGADDRGWVYKSENGGHLLETFLHNVLIASLMCGDPRKWTDVAYSERETDTGADAIELTAKCGQATIELYQEKNAPPQDCNRFAQFVFAHGTIEIDLDAKLATIFFEDMDKHSTLSVKQEYADKYSVLADMAARVASGECRADKTDGYPLQVETIRWLMGLKK